MSAFLLSNNHVNTLVSYAKYRLNGRDLYPANGKRYNLDREYEQIAKELRIANEESLKYRYPQAQKEFDEYPFVAQELYTGDFKEEDLISAIECYHYQSCEHPLYQRSDAYFIAEAIKNVAVRALVDGKSEVWAID